MLSSIEYHYLVAVFHIMLSSIEYHYLTGVSHIMLSIISIWRWRWSAGKWRRRNGEE